MNWRKRVPSLTFELTWKSPFIDIWIDVKESFYWHSNWRERVLSWHLNWRERVPLYTFELTWKSPFIDIWIDMKESLYWHFNWRERVSLLTFELTWKSFFIDILILYSYLTWTLLQSLETFHYIEGKINQYSIFWWFKFKVFKEYIRLNNLHKLFLLKSTLTRLNMNNITRTSYF